MPWVLNMYSCVSVTKLLAVTRNTNYSSAVSLSRWFLCYHQVLKMLGCMHGLAELLMSPALPNSI